MGFRCGVVGLPNVGKSTLFNALTAHGIPAENYPFCTIDPNEGLVAVPDARLDALAALVKPQAVLPTYVSIVDIAGLVAGAASGEGLGNQFLAHIREVQAIMHVVRCFEDDDVVHVAGRVDPISDIETIDTELGLADLVVVERALLRVQKVGRSGDKVALAQQAVLTRAQNCLAAGELLRGMDWSEVDLAVLGPLQLLTMKPLFYVANIDENTDVVTSSYVQAVRQHAESEGVEVVVVCGAIEAEIAMLPPADQQDFLTDLGVTEPGLNRVIRAGYGLLDLQTYFTAGEKEVRAWTVRCGACAPAAAGVIHTDFEQGFIRAEVISYVDFIACGGEQGAKAAGKWRLEGKQYEVADGDVMLFRFNV